MSTKYFIAKLFFCHLSISLLLFAGGCKSVIPISGYALLDHLYQRQTRSSFENCVFACQGISKCLSVNYNKNTANCDLNNATAYQFPEDFSFKEYQVYVEDVQKEYIYCVKLHCKNGGTCVVRSTPPQEICICKHGFNGRICEDCANVQALGMENGKINDSQITASSDYGGRQAWRARLNSQSDGWTAATSNKNQYLQISFEPEIKRFNIISTQGAAISKCWVKAYSLKYRVTKWKDYIENGKRKVFKGNFDQNTIVNNTLVTDTMGKVLRICIEDWYSCVSLRVELYECLQ